jgi:DNA-binding transcriptional regulator YiaG
MQITTKHTASSYGHPVILDGEGQLLEEHQGVQAVRRMLGLTTAAMAERCGVSRRTVEGWEQGRSVPTAALNVMADLVDDAMARR